MTARFGRRGAHSPGRPDSAGAQFFIVLADQPALDGQYHGIRTGLGRHGSAGRRSPETAVDASGVAVDRVDITRVTIRDTPASQIRQRLATGSRSATALCLIRALERSGLEFMPDKAPETVRQFLRSGGRRCLHRDVRSIASRPGFVIQTGALNTRARAADRESSEAGAQPAAGVQRHQTREGHCLDGARRRSGERHDVVLHLHRHVAGARRRLHGVRARRGRDERGRGDRGTPRDRRGAEHPHRSEIDSDRKR